MNPLVERIRKLLALAASPNAHEAAQAAARAQAMIATHRLEAEIAALQAVQADSDPIEDGRDAPIEVGRRIRKWKTVLAGALAEANNCMAWIRKGEGEAICIVGRSRDREVVQALYDGLLKRIEWASATDGAGKDRAWHESFRIGAVDAIAEQLAGADREPRAAIEPAALVHIDHRAAAEKAALDAFIAAKFGPAKGRALRVDGRAYERGKAVGAELKPR